MSGSIAEVDNKERGSRATKTRWWRGKDLALVKHYIGDRIHMFMMGSTQSIAAEYLDIQQGQGGMNI